MPQNFCHANLQGHTFKNQDLTEANFSYADLRGTNFTNTNLTGANFSHAKFGLQFHQKAISLTCSSIISFFSVLVAAYSADFLAVLTNKNENPIEYILVLSITLILLTIFFFVSLRQNILAALGVLAISVGIAATTAALSNTESNFEVMVLIGALALAGVVAGIFGLSIATAMTIAITTKKATVLTVLLALLGGGAGILFGRGDLLLPILVTVAVVIFSTYIGWQAIAGSKKQHIIKQIAITLGAIGGTNFRNANLTNANFTQANLKNTDLSQAKLTRTRFYEAKELHLARVGGTILADPEVRTLLATGNGRQKNYLNANLQGANLEGADLTKVNLKGANISKATLKRACLDWGNLTLTQAVGTDFTKAQMTGACLEAWNIENSTKLEEVDCRFVYLLENPKLGTDDRERRPSSGEFAPGEFTKLFQEVLHTVDLIFRDGVDWKAFVTAFKKLQIEHDGGELAIQSIENKGDGVVVVKVNVSPEANKEKIHSSFTQNYQLALQELEVRYKAELQAKDREIIALYREKSSDLKEIVGLLANNQPIHLTNQVKAIAESKAMDKSTDSSRNIKIGDISGDFNANSSLNLGDISGAVTSTINQLPSSPTPEKPGIKELLVQLQEAIANESELDDEDKAEALEQIKNLAEAGQNPTEGKMQKLAKKATTMLRGIAAALPDATKLVQTCKEILPAIATFFGLP